MLAIVVMTFCILAAPFACLEKYPKDLLTKLVKHYQEGTFKAMRRDDDLETAVSVMDKIRKINKANLNFERKKDDRKEG